MTQRLAWYDFSFDIPEHWEASRYSISAPEGRFEFNDRFGSLGRLSWEQSKRVPDEGRILTEYHRRYLQQYDEDAVRGFSGIRTRRTGKFLTGYRNDGEPCQALLYMPECRKVLVWVFPEYSREKMDKIWAPVLESFRPNSSEWRDWSAFGISCSLPADFEIETAVCNPGDVWFEFQNRKMHRVDLHRWGLPAELLRNSDMERFIRRVVISQEGRVLECRKGEFRGMESLELSIETRGTKGRNRLFSSYWKGVGRVWHNAEEKRLYAYFQAAPASVPLINEERLLAL